jgi:DNA polymerase-3 subunit alpha
MYVGPGRGSAAGSLVAYSLGISHVDPVANGLLFERFLNPDRISMPDIDTDFPDNRRDEIIRYMQEKYGKGHAAHIVTFATFKSKSALRDSARALGMPKEAPEKLCRMIVTKNGISETLQQAYDNHPEFARTVESSSSLKKLYETAKRLEGYPRHYSTHAGGIVLCRDLIEKHAPLLYMQGEDLPAVQFEMDYLEDLGLIKFDFLALKNLTIIDDVVQMARSAGHPVPDMLKIPLDDPKVFRLLGSAQTLGVFQLESDGIRDLLLRYKPKKFAEIADVIALYRPGPMKSIQSYLQARANPASIQSIHPLLDSLLKETGGIFLYQEQIMEAARIIGGFTLSQADTLRKAMSKKKKDVMESYARQFEEGAAEKGIPLEKAREIFSLMEQFAQYGYNKSHSYAYAMIVYQMAWLKVNEPLSFYICSLQSTLGASAKTAAFLSEMRAQNIPILPVSINRSKEFYLSENNAVRLPFAVIKGLGKQAAQKIVQEREQRGAYKDPALAIMRLLHAGLDKTQLKLLVKAGAFDELQVNRETLLDEFERILGMESILSWDEKGGCFITPGMSGVVLEPSAPREMERLYAEKELFGFYLSLHPCQILRNRDRRIAPICNVLPVLGNAAVCGIITRVKEHTTKNGQKMAFAAIEDDTGTIDCSIMPREYERYQNDLKEGVLLSVYGRKDRPASLLPSSLQFYSAADVLAQSRMQRQNSYAGKGQNRMR